MPTNVFPTKSNLLQAKRSLALAQVGYDLLDRKRSILTREMTLLLKEVQGMQGKIDAAFAEAYELLRQANFTMGQSEVLNIINSGGFADDVEIITKSTMGVETPSVRLREETPSARYGFERTNGTFDKAYIKFLAVRRLTAVMAGYENSVYRLAYAIKQAQKRANALQNIIIPQLEETIAYIGGYLEEKEREAFTVLKIIKKGKDAQKSADER